MLEKIGIAVLLSGLIGLERQKRFQKYSNQMFGGIRTYTLMGLLGALSFILSSYSILFFVVLSSGFLLFLIVSYVVTSRKIDSSGATSEFASILVYIVGILSAMGQFVLATAIALLVLAILHFKDPLHKWAKHLKNAEIVSTIEFAVIAFVVLPSLPNTEYGMYGFFNPYIVWLMVVLISGISFASYIAMKVLGARKGIGAIGFLGGLVSSTALTLSFAGESKKDNSIVNPYVAAIIIACSAMFFRVLVEVGILSPDLVGFVALPMVVMGTTGMLFAVFFWFGKEKGKRQTLEKEVKTVKNPFALMPALKFGVFFVLIMFFAKFGGKTFGEQGIYLTSAVSGLVDVDAITVSIANLFKDGLSKEVAVAGITIATIVNTIVKGSMLFILGGRKVSLRVCGVFFVIILSGLMASFLPVFLR